MGTRGFIGFVVDGVEKIAYNHWDSYPSGLGKAVLEWLVANRHSLICDVHRGESGAVVDLARRLRVIDPNSEPTDEDIAQLKGFLDSGVGEQKERPDWYQLLRRTQGNLGAMLEAGVIEDAHEFPLDSLFAEWGYLVDFDAGTFEAYKGFQTSPHKSGRFAEREVKLSPRRSGGYYPCALVHSWPLADLPSTDEFLAILQPPREDDE